MGKFHRILEPGLAILVPFLDRIAYVKSLKESAIEIPSQNAITADNVTLELDGVLYTRVFDAYKARYATTIISCFGSSCFKIVLTFEGYAATEWKTPNMLFLSLRRQPCDRRSAS
jgi:regulator of protease activity HflC (stomatin/prohibitin superfamily)